MQKTVETNVVNEAPTAAPAEDTAKKYPEYDIQRLTKDTSKDAGGHAREVIRMHATSRVTYDKYYMPIGLTPEGAPKPIRRTKRVKLPMSLDGKIFEDTNSLWEYLQDTKQYSRAPKQVPRDKISRK